MEEREERGDGDTTERKPDREVGAAGWRPADVAEEALAKRHVEREPGEHADGRRAEPPVPAHALAESAADERREERAQVDAHVEDRERADAPRVAGRAEPPHHHRHAGLEVSGADPHGGTASPQT